VVDQISRHEDDRYGDRDQISLGTLWRRSPHIVYALSDTLIDDIKKIFDESVESKTSQGSTNALLDEGNLMHASYSDLSEEG